MKPKSWDNLTTKAFGGYGFGYGYLDMSAKGSQKARKSQGTQYVRVDKMTTSAGSSQTPVYTPHGHRR